MSIIGAIALVEAGYILGTRPIRGTGYYSIKNKLKQIACQKLDDLFLGNYSKDYECPRRQYRPYFPSRYHDGGDLKTLFKKEPFIENLTFDKREDAVDFFNYILKELDRYGKLSIFDYYDNAIRYGAHNIPMCYSDGKNHNYGWYNIDEEETYPVLWNGRWVIHNLPEPEEFYFPDDDYSTEDDENENEEEE